MCVPNFSFLACLEGYISCVVLSWVILVGLGKLDQAEETNFPFYTFFIRIEIDELAIASYK